MSIAARRERNQIAHNNGRIEFWHRTGLSAGIERRPAHGVRLRAAPTYACAAGRASIVPLYRSANRRLMTFSDACGFMAIAWRRWNSWVYPCTSASDSMRKILVLFSR